MGSVMQSDLVSKDDVPWWMKYAGRGLGTVGGGLAIFWGVWNCTAILHGDVDCLLVGMWQTVAGFVVIVLEAPCCCMFIDFVQGLSERAEKRPYWNRAALYVALAVPPILLCPSLGSLSGSGSILGTGVLYAIMALGRKATAQEMRQNASQLGEINV